VQTRRNVSSIRVGTHGLTVDPVTEFRADHSRRGQVDAAAKETLELVLDPGKTEVADRVVELGDEVDVAVGPGMIARDGAEDEERVDTEPAKVVPVGSEELDGIGTAHGRIVGPGVREWTGSRDGGFVIPEPDE
jgi:hypothetical protein